MRNDNLQTLYNAANDMAKHYSSVIHGHRITVVTAGILALAASGKILLDKSNPLYAAAISLWGLLFVISMFFLVRHYRAHAKAASNAAARIEEEICSRAQVSSGAWINIIRDHDSLEGNFIRFLLHNNLTFVIMAVAFVFILIYSLLLYYG